METTKNFIANMNSKYSLRVQSMWFDLAKFDSFAQFKQVVLDLCESTDNFKIEDYIGIPKELLERFTFANEFLFEEAFEDFQLYEMADSDTQRAYEHYLREMDSFGSFNEFSERYQGYFTYESDFAIWYVEEIGLLDGISSDIANYFDYEAYAIDLFLNGDFTYCNGYVFSC